MDEEIRKIVDTIACSDSGISLVKLRFYLARDDVPQEIKETVRKFSKLCEYFYNESS